MSKILNAKVKQTVAIGLIAASTKKAGVKLVKELRVLREEVRKVLIEHFNSTLPELSDPERQLELLRERTLTSVSLGNTWVTKYNGEGKSDTSSEFAFNEWTHKAIEKEHKRKCALWNEVVAKWGGSDVVDSSGFATQRPDLRMVRSFPDVPYCNRGTYTIVCEPHRVPHIADKHHTYHIKMGKLHDKIMKVLIAMENVLHDSLSVLDDVEASLVPIKNVEQLSKLFPEAMVHLPADFVTEKPTQQLADPSVINEIRAKLAAGLPV